MARFMLLIRGGGDGWQTMTPEQMQQTVQRYFAWSDQLRAEGRLAGSDELMESSATVRQRDGQPVIDGPYVETKDAIGGYYLIEAASADEAAAVAKGCPTLSHGGFVEVRGIVERER